MKELTRRQRQFLSKFLEVYERGRQPLHYGVLAEHLGVNKVSAYEMLRLLEARGLVETEYQVPAGARGPGRAPFVFRPTPLAAQEIARLAGDDVSQSEWDAVKAHIMKRLKAARGRGYGVLLRDLVLRTPEQPSPLVYVAGMITAILLGLRSLRDTAEVQVLRESLEAIGRAGGVSLGVFAGLGMGLSVAGHINRRVADFLLGQSARFQTALAQLSDENLRRLSEFTREAMQVMEASPGGSS